MMDGPVPIRGVVFDFHSTLVDGGDPDAWLAAAWRHSGLPGTPQRRWDESGLQAVRNWLDPVWDHASEIDPTSERDLSPEAHARITRETLRGCPDLKPAEVEALAATVDHAWVAYDDAAPTLRALRDLGVPVAVLSNIGIDIRPVLERDGLTDLVDAVALSVEEGVVKPDPAIFERALAAIGVPAAEALMVGDNAAADSGGVALGMRTLLLPRTSGPVHGLSLVVDLVRAGRPGGGPGAGG